MVVLSKAGDHVPVIPLLDVVGNGANVSPLQIGSIAVNVGVTAGVIVKSNVLLEAGLVAILKFFNEI